MKKRFLLAALTAFLLLSTPGDAGPGPRTLLAGSRGFSLIQWEITAFPEKWLNYVKGFIGLGSDSATLEEVEEFFAVGQDLRRAEDDLERAVTLGEGDIEDLHQALNGAEEEWARRRSSVEQTIEGLISSVVRDMRLTMKPLGIKELQFPPVDIRFGDSPRVLILSPRNRIERQFAYLLETDISVLAIEELEDAFLARQDLSALVVPPGGLATYPAVISPFYSLDFTLKTIAHEWSHHYLMFYPLGRSYFGSDGRMITVNETLAELIGKEVSREAYFRLTGERLPELPKNDGSQPPPSADDPDRFDFNSEMRETRLRVDDLLAEGQVEEAETYMEERRQVFLANGYLVRKLNQAYFAFYGLYAASSASSSPVGNELEDLRTRFETLEEMVEAIRQVGSYESYSKVLEENGVSLP
jgi:hypothetical protein